MARVKRFAVIEGPVEFRMGSPPNEPDRSLDETPHRQTIPRRLAIATKEVTVEQFQQFVQADPKIMSNTAPRKTFWINTAVPSNGPMICVSWYAAAAYCNWLSQQGEPARVLRAERGGRVCRWDEDPGRCLAAAGLSVAYRG